MARIGLFDSGVGGLSVWREIARLLPSHDTIYLADQENIPYGSRPASEIRRLAHGITHFLVERGCDPVVVACNTASAAALASLRARFPHTRFVGMEPAVKPAAANSRRRVVGVLATEATFQGDLFATTLERFAADVHVVRQICPGLVERIESGDLDGPETRALLSRFLQPSLAAGADTIVLACTHYPFVRRTIEALVGAEVTVIDPAPAIARQVQRVLRESHLEGSGDAIFLTTGDLEPFERVAGLVLERPLRSGRAVWREDALEAAETT